MLIRIIIVITLAAGIFGGAYYAVHRLYLEPEQRILRDRALPPPTPVPDPSLAEFDRCAELQKSGSPAEARAAFQRFLREFPESKKRDDAFDAIGTINSAEFFSTPPTEATTTIVRPGDSLGRIAARTKLSVEFIVHLNRLTRDTIQPGQRLHTPPVEFRAVLQQRTRRIILHQGAQFFRQYPTVAWPGAQRKPPIFLPKVTGKVTDKIALNERGPVKPTDPAYAAAAHLLQLSIPGHSLYTQPEDPAAPVNRPTGGGIGIAPALMGEIAILLPKGATVTLE